MLVLLRKNVIVNRDIPMKYISPAAEEMLAYGNTVPEWLCPSRQEKVVLSGCLFLGFNW
jgi:hypothetical protein